MEKDINNKFLIKYITTNSIFIIDFQKFED